MFSAPMATQKSFSLIVDPPVKISSNHQFFVVLDIEFTSIEHSTIELALINDTSFVFTNIFQNRYIGSYMPLPQIIMNPASLKLNIFLMDDYQRRLFNYTYITDRLRKRLI